MEIMKKRLKSIALLIMVISASSFGVNAQTENEIGQEIDNMLSSGGKLLNLDNIQSSLMDQLSNMLSSQLASALGSSPISEVNALKGVITESYNKQQKMISTQIEIEQEKNKAMTTISPQVANYYNELNLSSKFSELAQKTSTCKTKINSSKAINVGTQDLLVTMLNKNSATNEIKGKVRTATNQNGQVWMGEAERVQILNESVNELDKKLTFVAEVNRRVASIEGNYYKALSRRKKSQDIVK
jgi:hypothetical protein